MKHLLLIAGSTLLFSTLVPEPADAQSGMRRGAYRGGVVRRGVVVRPGIRPGYAYRRGYYGGPGWGPAVGLGVLGGAALGAAAVSAGGLVDPCLRQQQVYDVYGNVVWQTVRVC